MPQFDPATFSPQIIWLVISFSILYIAMSRIALPRIGVVIEERRHKIDENLKKAAELQKDAKAASEAYEKTLVAARAESQNLLRRSREKTTLESSRRHDELGVRLFAEVKTAEEKIGDAKKEALTHVRGIAVEVALSAAAKLFGENPDGKAVADAVTAAMEDRS
ncbi:MAG: hypothetical protein A3H92_11905 [Rhodospirillales bacterium RIFCSPLOWO2_02_FULL_58_16]|nr:MAG: hypothetical protein A3H92_11905 [Rhodospirillales bacterium RIFCSPLOWO2_02_FULL_58_16]